MHAPHHVKCPLGLRELALLDIFHPRAVHTDGYVMLLLARHRAGMTADALTVVYDEPVISHLTDPS